MTAPPVLDRTLSSTARLADKGTSPEVDHGLKRRLIDAGVWVAEQRGLPTRRRRVRDLVDRYLETGRSDLLDDTRTVTDFRAWFITYADPTGETATRNADQQRSRT